MRTGFLITGLVILLIANILMLFYKPGSLGTEGFTNAAATAPRKVSENFTNYFLENAGPTSGGAIGAFDGVRLSTGNKVSAWRSTAPDEPLMGPEFQPGPDSLFIFKNNQCKPECCGSSFSCGGGCVCTTPQQRQLIAGRGGNRTSPAGDI
jgi:hypothetical protein